LLGLGYILVDGWYMVLPVLGQELQDRYYCTNYDGKRSSLVSFSRDIFLPEILGTEAGIKALTSFLLNTEAFKNPKRRNQEKTLPTFENEPEPQNPDRDDDED
jgi:hypothetical protein